MNIVKAEFNLLRSTSYGERFAAASVTLAIFFKHRMEKDHSVFLSSDLQKYIVSLLILTDPKDMIALGGTNKLWRQAVNDVCHIKLQDVFGDLEESKMPISVAAELWAPLLPKTSRLATLVPGEPRETTPQMAAVLEAIESGTVKELEQKIELLGDITELTTLRLKPLTNPLSLAIESGDIEKVRLLIAFGVPIAAGEEGVICFPEEAPLVRAALKEEVGILKLLLENGASFSVKEEEKNGPCPLIYGILITIGYQSTSVANKKILACVALIMRSWRNEKGLKAIQDDKELAIEAGNLLVNPYCHRIAQLLMTYGIIPDVKEDMLSEAITISIAINDKEHLERLNRQGWLDFKSFRLSKEFTSLKFHIKHEMTLADCACLFGQFELEEYLVREKQVPYNTLEAFRKSRLETYISQAMENMSLENHSNECIFTIEPQGQKRKSKGLLKIPGRKCNWKRLLEIVDHYKIQIGTVACAKKKFQESPFFSMCRLLFKPRGAYDKEDSKQERSYLFARFEFLLQVIEDLVQRGASLDRDLGGGASLEGLREHAKSELSKNSDH